MADYAGELAELDVDASELDAEDTVVVTDDIDAWIEEMLSGPDTDEDDGYASEDDYPY